MKLWYKACLRCGGDLMRETDVLGAPYIKFVQCGTELTRSQEAGLLRLGYVPAVGQEPAPVVQMEGWRR